MHQDNLKSAVYRSLRKTLLVGCRDFDEPIQCGAIRKPMSSSSHAAMVETSHTRRAHPGISPISLAGREEGRKSMAYGGSSELQLLDISEKVEKLNNMLDLWSKAAMTKEGQSRDMTEELFRGALELQESLIILQKLQEEQKFLALTRGRCKCNTFMGGEGDDSYQNGWQGPRHSTGSSSSNRFEELRKLIKDSLCRQNLLSTSSDEEETSSSTQKFPRGDVFSQTGCDRKDRPESFVYSIAQEKTKPPNLIAKLMCLEEAPSATVPHIKKEAKEKKRLRFSELVFDVEMPKAKSSQSKQQKMCPKRKTLKEVMGSMQLKDLMEDDQGEDHVLPSGFCDASQMERYRRDTHKFDEAPHIVITKSMHLQSFERESMQEDPVFDNFSIKEEIQVAQLTEKIIPDPHQEREEEKIKEMTTKELYDNTESSASLSHKHRERKAIKNKEIKQPVQIQKPLVDRKRAEENRNASTKPRYHAKTSPSIQTKAERRPTPAKNRVPALSNASKLGERNTANSVSHDSIGFGKKRKARPKPVEESEIVAPVVDSKCKEDNKEHNSSQGTDSLPLTASSSSSNHLPKQLQHDYTIPRKDRGRKDPNSLCEVMPKLGQGGSNPRPPQEESEIPTQETDDEKNIKSLLLSSPSFLNQAHELFNLSTHYPEECQAKTGENVTKDLQHILDCGIELLECKSYRSRLRSHPMFQSHQSSARAIASPDHLVEEIGVNIHELRSYTKIGGGETSDGLYVRLERDLSCSVMLGSGGWDWGWIDGYSVEEEDHFGCDIEQIITSMLVEEVLMELMR